MKGWLHCLLTNCPEIAIQHLQDWVLYQTSLHTGGMQQQAPAAMSGGGSLGRGRITKREHVSRKTVAEVPPAAAAVAAAEEVAAASSREGCSDSGGLGPRSTGFDVGVALRGGAGGGHAVSSPAPGVVNGSSAGATREVGDFASPDLPPVRFSAATAGSVLDSYGSGAGFPVAAAGGAAHNTASSAPATTAEHHGGASYNLLDLFPKTAAAAAVAAAALTAGAAVTGDGSQAVAPGSIDHHLTPARQASQPEIMQVDVHPAEVRVGEHDDAAIPGSVVAAGRGRAEGGPEASLVGDLNIDSPSTVAGILLSNDGEVASGVVDVAATAAAAAAASPEVSKLAARRSKFV